MAEDKHISGPKSKQQPKAESGASTPPRPLITRRDFLVRGNAGAVAIGVMAGTGFATGFAQPAAEASQAVQPATTLAPVTMRRVSLDIDGKKHDVNVDVRESIWETLNYQLGLSNCNLGCDRAQCGACTVLVDGRPVNGCTVLSARCGRGQKIVTVAGIARGPGVQGLHPVQRAFWLEGGFQCGICTRGFVMSAYALLQTNPNPTHAEIKEALAGNICRCGEYAKMFNAVKKAAAELRGEQVRYTAPLVTGEEIEEAAAAPVGRTVSRQFVFVNPLGTIELFDELEVELSQVPGIVEVSGTERTITPVWDPSRLDEARVRRLLSDMGHPVRP